MGTLLTVKHQVCCALPEIPASMVAYVDPKKYVDTGLLGYVKWHWAIVLHTSGVRVIDSEQVGISHLAASCHR